jgi:predicted nucleic acid-binding protein
MILLDTNVILELVRAAQLPSVVAYVEGLDPDAISTAAVCEAEIRFGLTRMAAGRRRDGLVAQMDAFFDIGFAGRVLPFDRLCAAAYGAIRQARESAGRPMTVMDAMIAATAVAYGARAVATRKVGDFEGCGVVVDPWEVG